MDPALQSRIAMKKNAELRAMARTQLEGTWLAAAGMRFVYSIILGISSIVGVGPLILGGPLELGHTGYFLKKARGEAVKVDNLFDGFKQFGSSFLLFLLRAIFIMLWSCLLIIPGIIKGYSYSMAFYIMKDNPDIGALGAITQSRKMMDGHKGKLFELYVSFIGWAVLCWLPVGISFFWFLPYMRANGVNLFGSSLTGMITFFMLILNSFGWVVLGSLLSGIGSLVLGLYMSASITNFYEELKKHNTAAIQHANTEAVYNNEEKKASQSKNIKAASKKSAKSTSESKKKITVNAFNDGIYGEDAEFQYSEVDGRILARDKATKLDYYVLKENNWVKISRS
jgi:uncharacterized membrane protein